MRLPSTILLTAARVTDDFKKANHNPIAVLNGDQSRNAIHLHTRPGECVRLSADGTTDPDGSAYKTTWFVYPEAGSFRGEVKLCAANGASTSLIAPAVEKPETIHIILQFGDGGSPSLVAYRRAIVAVRP